ncbi:MAG: hypothetical protein RX316_01730 [bacterium]|nr:hypothetical protein [bacterium]
MEDGKILPHPDGGREKKFAGSPQFALRADAGRLLLWARFFLVLALLLLYLVISPPLRAPIVREFNATEGLKRFLPALNPPL